MPVAYSTSSKLQQAPTPSACSGGQQRAARRFSLRSRVPELLLADVVDLEASPGGKPFGMGLDACGERLGELLKIEDADAARRQIGRHAIGATERGQHPADHHAIPTRDHSRDLFWMPLGQQLLCHDATSGAILSLLVAAPPGPGAVSPLRRASSDSGQAGPRQVVTVHRSILLLRQVRQAFSISRAVIPEGGSPMIYRLALFIVCLSFVALSDSHLAKLGLPGGPGLATASRWPKLQRDCGYRGRFKGKCLRIPSRRRPHLGF